MSVLPRELRDLIESGPMAHLSTISPYGSPQVTVIWIGLDDRRRRPLGIDLGMIRGHSHGGAPGVDAVGRRIAGDAGPGGRQEPMRQESR